METPAPMTTAFCSVLSREAGELLAGTADRVDVWLMLEYRAVWRPKAVTDNELGARTTGWLAEVLESYRRRGLAARIQFIRQQSAGDLRLLTVRDGATTLRSAPDYDGLPQAPERALDERLYFVCTHGQRDLCCAQFGLPLYRALRERVGDRAWQTSHLGGHRFAPNVLVTPEAVLYGRVDAGNLDAFLDDTENGRLHRPCARGRTRYPEAAQAAEVLGEAGTPLQAMEALGDDTWRVRFTDRSVQVQAHEVSALASCGDGAPKTGRAWTLAR